MSDPSWLLQYRINGHQTHVRRWDNEVYGGGTARLMRGCCSLRSVGSLLVFVVSRRLFVLFVCRFGCVVCLVLLLLSAVVCLLVVVCVASVVSWFVLGVRVLLVPVVPVRALAFSFVRQASRLNKQMENNEMKNENEKWNQK